MRFYIYDLPERNQRYVSLSYEVDCYFWNQQGLHPVLVGTTLSIGVADQLCYRQRNDLISGSHIEEWNELDEQSWRSILEKVAITRSILAGRALLWQEVESVLKRYEQNWKTKTIAQVLQYFILQGWATLLPGVYITGPALKWKCHRCFATGKMLQVTNCARCEERCALCEHCILLGKSRTCIPFIQFKQNAQIYAPRTNFDRSVHVSLTEAQHQVVSQIERWLYSKEKHLLLWAVTGAGKTEMMVPIVSQMIQHCKKVLWVTPRKDVVLELAPRLKKILGQSKVRALYGGSKEHWLDGNCMVATAHQCLRYIEHFDLAIVDEVDAFPLYQNEWLEKGITRALKKEAKLLFLTATPPREWKSLAYQERLSTVILSQRYHGFPLPIPKLIQERNLWKRLMRQTEISSISDFLVRMIERNGQAMIFVPRIQDVKAVTSWIRIKNPALYSKTRGVYGNQLDREEAIQNFRHGKIQILVTTTILERGVTVTRCHVLVIGADHLIFDRATLIQIAGRVGRSAYYQKGEVIFLANEKTEAQIQAKKELEWLNLHSQKEGNQQKKAYWK